MTLNDCPGFHREDLSSERCAHLQKDGTCVFFSQLKPAGRFFLCDIQEQIDILCKVKTSGVNTLDD